ncbi:hypothetical protein NL676_031166 [Syzygium grande]|nr:hypothetical protein NL676_031166 [Syzygium grande]
MILRKATWKRNSKRKRQKGKEKPKKKKRGHVSLLVAKGTRLRRTVRTLGTNCGVDARVAERAPLRTRAEKLLVRSRQAPAKGNRIGARVGWRGSRPPYSRGARRGGEVTPGGQVGCFGEMDHPVGSSWTIAARGLCLVGDFY